MHGHQRDSANGGNSLEMFGNASFSLLEIGIVWDPHLFAWNFGNQFCVRPVKVDDAHFPVFCKPVEIFLKKKTKMRSCNWLQADTYSSSTAPLYEANASFKTCIKNRFIFWFVASHKIGFQSFRQTNVDLRQCWSPTLRKRHFQTFPNSSHLLLNLFDVHAFPLHHLPVWYAIFVSTKPYMHRVLKEFFRSSLNH